MEKERRKAWQHPENLIPMGEIEREIFGDRTRRNTFGFGTAFDEFIAADMVSEDVFGDDPFEFGMTFDRSPFPILPEASGARSRSRARASRPSSSQTRISRPAAASASSRRAGDPGASPSTDAIRQNAAASSFGVPTRAVAGSNRQPNDVASSRSAAPATTIASSSRTVSAGPSNLSQVADRTTAARNDSPRPDPTTSARLHATTAHTSLGVLNPNRRTETGTTIGQPLTPHTVRGTTRVRTLRTSRGNSMGRSNTQRLASMATSSMFESEIFPVGIYAREVYPVLPYGYGLYEDPYFDDYEYGYYGGRRYY